jgi:hypothetical protein
MNATRLGTVSARSKSAGARPGTSAQQRVASKAPAGSGAGRGSKSKSESRRTPARSGRDPRVDAYVESAAAFAQPILRRLRDAVHAGCPEVVETIKWRMPSFEHHGILAGMAAFQKHCVFGFWKHELLVEDAPREMEAMGSFGCLRTVGDLPSQARLVALVRRAVALNEAGVKAPRTKTARKQPAPLHPEFARALDRHARARATFEGFSPSHRREYQEWIAEAKKDETRERRIETAIEWLAAGKSRNWKYERRAGG